MKKRLKKKMCKGLVIEALRHYAIARNAAWNEYKKRSDEISESLKCLAKAAKLSPVRPHTATILPDQETVTPIK